MTDSDNSKVSPLPDDIAIQASKEKLMRRGALTGLHKWWARRPLVQARIA